VTEIWPFGLSTDRRPKIITHLCNRYKFCHNWTSVFN